VEGGGAAFEADNLLIIRVEGGVAVDQGANVGNGIGGNADGESLIPLEKRIETWLTSAEEPKPGGQIEPKPGFARPSLRSSSSWECFSQPPSFVA
jgi:hypothetical protein